MDALRIIGQEHGNLWRLATAIEAVATEIDGGRPVDRDFFQAVFDYLEKFVDHVHHPKEDEFLFPRLQSRSAEAEAVIAQLTLEHRRAPDDLSALRRLLAEIGSPEGNRGFVIGLRAYTAAQKEHIRLEEKEILPLARSLLSREDWQAIDAAFSSNSDPLFGETARAEYKSLFHRVVSLAPETVGLGAHSSGSLKSPERKPLLHVSGVESSYGRIKALKGVSLDVGHGEIVALVGANGAGKTTFLRALSGVQPISAGRIEFAGEDVTRLRSDQRVRRGICQSPEGRQVFGPLSIEDNLRLGAYTQPKERASEDLAKIYEMFPILQEKRHLPAGTLSGGQQQMLAIGRALMGRPKLLLLDEPSMGLAPLLVEEVFNVVTRLRDQGITILLIEQNAFAALAIADRGYVMETGTVTMTGTGKELLESDEVRAAYLGM